MVYYVYSKGTTKKNRKGLIKMAVSKRVEKVIGLRRSIEEARYTMRNSYDDSLVLRAELRLDYLPDDLGELEESLTHEEREELTFFEYEEALSEGDRWG